ncbi:MAG: DUF72 domain-containing protein [Deltaproteobacteria bacterium]|nr:DUF72 domain-containing protein [Deltaproteobacteria bacterium]
MASLSHFFLGCAVWAYKGWLGEFFPPGSRTADFLRLYSQRLTAVEINATFDGVPSRETVTRWAAETPPGFRFCPKLPRDLTHKGLLQPSIPGALQFGKLMQGLGDRLGPIFVQLPPQYGPTMLHDLGAFLATWPRQEIPLAVEVRHPDWFREPHSSALTSLLERNSVGRVLLDTRPIYEGPDDPQVGMERRKPKLPLHPCVTAPFSLVRFISHPQQKSNNQFMEEWLTQVEQWLHQGIQIYFFVHCPIEEHSPGTARHFQSLLEQRKIPVPSLPWNTVTSAPTQLRLFS